MYIYKQTALLLRWGQKACRSPSIVENPVRLGRPLTIFLAHPLCTSTPQNANPKHDDSKKKFPYKVGFIGAGNMAKAIGFSVLDAGLLSKKDLMVSAPLPEFLEPWKQKGVNTTEDNAEAVSFGDIIFLLAPPQDFDDVIDSLRKSSLKADYKKCIVSTMVGKTIQFIEDKFKIVEGLQKPPPQIVRITPNMPITVGAGCTIIAGDEETDYFKAVQQLMRVSGTCELIPERLMNVCTATSGSGPAYVYLVIEGLADGAVRAGVHRSTAYRLAAQAVIGAGQMVFKTGKHPGQLKDEICSEGGSTIAGVHALEEGGVRCAFINAIVAATKRAEELGSHRQSFLTRELK